MLKCIFLLIVAAVVIASPAGEKRAGCNQDNLYRCFTHSPAVASPFCSGYVTPTTVYVATVTPTSTIGSTTTSTVTVPATSYTSTTSVTTTITTLASTVTTTVVQTATTVATASVTVIGNKKRSIHDAEDLFKRAAQGPTCLTTETPHTTSYPASRISSACSCIGVTQSTVFATATASPVTSRVTSSAGATATSTTIVIVTVTQTSITTSITSTTATSLTATTTTTIATATATETPYGTNDCVDGATAPAGDGYTFTFYCGATLTFYFQVASSTQSSFSSCYQSCVDFGACDAFIYNIVTGNCLLSNGAYRGPVSSVEYDTGVITF